MDSKRYKCNILEHLLIGVLCALSVKTSSTACVWVFCGFVLFCFFFFCMVWRCVGVLCVFGDDGHISIDRLDTIDRCVYCVKYARVISQINLLHVTTDGPICRIECRTMWFSIPWTVDWPVPWWVSANRCPCNWFVRWGWQRTQFRRRTSPTSAQNTENRSKSVEIQFECWNLTVGTHAVCMIMHDIHLIDAAHQ